MIPSVENIEILNKSIVNVELWLLGVWVGSEIGWEGEIAKNMRKILGMMNMFTIWIVVTVVWVYIQHFEGIHCIIWE